MILVADPDLRDLGRYQTKRVYKAAAGGHGLGAGKHGADGTDVELRVPAGTQVLDEEERLDRRPRYTRVARRRGARRRRWSRKPSLRDPDASRASLRRSGHAGEEAGLELRLKLLADAALVGMPNAGKSSLLRRISNAKPKVAEYPFTTLSPVLGTIDAPDGRQLTVADVPGLIEGASEGVGLGHEFLAHLERARLLVHVIDASEGDPADRFATIERELEPTGPVSTGFRRSSSSTRSTSRRTRHSRPMMRGCSEWFERPQRPARGSTI